jgi:hypothetical protein
MKRDSVNVELQENGQSCCVEDKNLADYDFPPDAQLFLEIYDRYAFQREFLGSFSSFKRKDSIKISELISREALRYRLKLVDKTQGRILGEAKGLATVSSQQPDSLLPFQLDDLTNLVYEVECSTYERPLLRVNQRLLGIDIEWIVENDPIFHALVLPAVVKKILTQIVLDDAILEINGNKWQNLWLYFIVNECHIRQPPIEGEDEETLDDYETTLKDWINDAVQAFCYSHSFIEDFETRYKMVRENE